MEAFFVMAVEGWVFYVPTIWQSAKLLRRETLCGVSAIAHVRKARLSGLRPMTPTRTSSATVILP